VCAGRFHRSRHCQNLLFTFDRAWTGDEKRRLAGESGWTSHCELLSFGREHHRASGRNVDHFLNAVNLREQMSRHCAGVAADDYVRGIERLRRFAGETELLQAFAYGVCPASIQTFLQDENHVSLQILA
jgi:hypothetical protein